MIWITVRDGVDGNHGLHLDVQDDTGTRRVDWKVNDNRGEER